MALFSQAVIDQIRNLSTKKQF